MKQILFLCVCMAAISSCTQYSAEYKQAVAENDSLRLQIQKNEAEMNEMITSLNVIEDGMRSIREAEDYLNVQKDSELTASNSEQIKNNLALIMETLKNNKEQIVELQNKLKASNIHSSALQQTIDRISKELNEKGELIVQLQEELGRKDEQINQLSEQVEGLSTDLKILEGVNLSQTELISEQDKTINTVYYCFGTKKELKEQKILTGGGLFSKTKALEGDFNEDYFNSIDKRSVKTIRLYASKAEIKTNHPEGSYKFVKDTDGNLSLEITDYERFWSLSKYLVIEVG